MSTPYGLSAVVAVILATVAVGAYGLRISRTTSDFLVASRTVSPLWNASAIGGEYLSAASFLGIAGLVLAFGADMLWYPVGFAAGYLVLLLFIAAPLRRSGAYTLPDFAEARLGSRGVRVLASVAVVVIGWLYLLPQLQGAGLTLNAVTGAPREAGAVVVALVVTLTVAGGGMRSITFVQAFQYWLKVTAIAVPAVVLLLAWQADGSPSLTDEGLPTFPRETTVEVDDDVRLDVGEPVTVTAAGDVGGVRRDGPVQLQAGETPVAAGTTLTFPSGTAVPHVERIEASTGRDWSLPLSGAGGRDHPLYGTWSLTLALLLGTMGLPHVLVRFYTNPDGHAARQTTLVVLALLGAFYLMPAVYGALGRLYTPELLLNGETDAVVLLLPTAMIDGVGGQLLAALVTAGAFAAFLSTSTGLVAVVAGVLGQDLLPVLRRGRRGGSGDSLSDLRRATLLAGLVPLLLAVPATGRPVSQVVGLAFAVAASTFCPLLVLGIWWRGLTDVGAAAGVLVGAVLAGGAALVTLFGAAPPGWAGALLASPAAWSVPASFLTMAVVSLATSRRIPADVASTMLRLHAPESLGLTRPDPRRP